MTESRNPSPPPVAPAEEWVTLLAAAKRLGRSRLTVLTLATERRLTVDVRAGKTFLRTVDVDALEAELRTASTATPLAQPAVR